VHGITKFSDMSGEEFAKVFLTLKPSQQPLLNVTVVENVPRYTGAETFVDWTGTYTTAVKDQGHNHLYY
jgi:hypothetical protein